MHVRGDEGYREAGESRAFAGWRADEIFGALTEDPLSAGTRRALERVALAMGAREGTRPGGRPLHPLAESAEGARHEAPGEARRGPGGKMLVENVRAVLRARGIEAALDASEDRTLIGALPSEALMAAALACTSEADFRRRARERLDPPPERSS